MSTMTMSANADFGIQPLTADELALIAAGSLTGVAGGLAAAGGAAALIPGGQAAAPVLLAAAATVEVLAIAVDIFG